MLSLLSSVALAASPPDIDAPLRTGASAPEDAAVVIGIEDYAFLPDVPGAARDARAVYNWLVYSRGVPPERVTLLQGGNREQILDAVAKARASVKGKGTLWISYAGHGATAPGDGGPLLVGDDAKADPSVFQSRSVPVSTFGPEAVLLLDTCWAGRGRDGADLVPGTRFAVPTWTSEPTSGAMLTAATPTQLSEPYAPAEHGLFTYFLIGGLRGWADGELDGAPDGQVTLREAHTFASRAIATVRPNGQQPTFSGQDRVLLAAPGRLEAAPDLAALPRWTGAAAATPAPAVRPAPLLGPPLLTGGRTWTGEVTLGDDGVLVAADGERLSLLDAAQATSYDRDVANHMARYQGARGMVLSGWTLAGTGVALGVVTGMVVAADTGSTTPVYSGIGAVAAMGIGTGEIVVGSARKKRERAELVHAINGAP